MGTGRETSMYLWFTKVTKHPLFFFFFNRNTVAKEKAAILMPKALGVAEERSAVQMINYMHTGSLYRYLPLRASENCQLVT